MNKYICRAKCIKTGKWIQGYYISKVDPLYNITYHYIVYQQRDKNGILDSLTTWWPIDPETLCRCIEWNDRHDTPIFENDIVEFKVSDTSYKYLIWWNREASQMTALDVKTLAFNGTDYLDAGYMPYDNFCLMIYDPYGDYSDIKVIGNIFDNTELMKDVIDLDYSCIADGGF